MNRRLFVLSMSLVGAFVLLVGVLRWGNAAAALSPSSIPQRVGAGSGFFTDSGQRLGGGDSWGVALGDLDGDGDLDIFGVVGEQVSIWLNVDDVAIEGVAAANDSPTSLGQTTTVTATVTAGSSVVYTWAFGDGQTATGATMSHLYANPGVYTATVTASNSLGQLIATTQVTINRPLDVLFMPLLFRP